jgi:hypothetical protein
MSTKSAIAFFVTKPSPSPSELKATAAATARAGLSKRDRAEVKAYLDASPEKRKTFLRADKIASGHLHTPETRRAWRRAYMRRYRSLLRLGTILL